MRYFHHGVLLMVGAWSSALMAGCLEVKNGGRRGVERAAVCAYQVRCGYIGASEEAACARSERYGPLPFLDGLALGRESQGYSTNAAIAAGRVALDAESETACLELLTVGDCGANVYTCLAMYRGRVPAGGACLDDRECVDGLCAVATSDGANFSGEPGCAGTCIGFVPLGGACGPFGRGCGPSAFCDPVEQVCRPRPALGETCGTGGALSDCAADLSCSPAQVCEAPHDAGQPCNASFYNGGCATSLRCVAGTCAPPGAAGAPCETNAAGLGGAGGAAEMGGLGGLGSGPCGEGLYCDPVLAQCQALHPDGDACSTTNACIGRHPCIGLQLDTRVFPSTVIAAGVCGPWGDRGSACDSLASPGICPRDMRCDAATGTCTRRDVPSVALGESCDAAIDATPAERCAEGSCDAKTRRCALVCESPF